MPSGSSRLPIGPCVPKSTSSAKPTTTGGSTSGRCTTASKSVLPGKALAREHEGDGDGEGQARREPPERDLEAEGEDLQLAAAQHGVTARGSRSVLEGRARRGEPR